jgi:hypothetical protein
MHSTKAPAGSRLTTSGRPGPSRTATAGQFAIDSGAGGDARHAPGIRVRHRAGDLMAQNDLDQSCVTRSSSVTPHRAWHAIMA